MKNMLKRVLFLGITTIAYTAYPECNFISSCKSFFDNIDYTIDAEFRALIFKPSSSNIYYAAQATPLPIYTPKWKIFDLHPNYRFGFDLGVNTRFHGCNTILSLNWEHFNSHTTDCHKVSVDTDMVGPLSEIGPDADQYKNAVGSVKFHFNTINLTYGQVIHCSDCWYTDVFAGINITTIKQNLSSVYSNDDASVTRSICTPSTFKGAGPQLGINFSYKIGCDFHFTGKLATAILVGPSANSTTFTSASPDLALFNAVAPNIQTICEHKRSQIVPAFEERLGISYSFTICRDYCAQIEVGYEARIYLNALQSTDMASQVVDILPNADTVGVFARTFQRNVSNFGLSGPYVAFDVTF